MADYREPSHPPSEPQHPPLGTLAHANTAPAAERPVRLQLFAALLLGLVLVATALYLWRRPSAPGDAERAAREELAAADAGAAASLGDPGSSASSGVATPTPAASTAASPSPDGLSLSDPRIVACRDGAKKVTLDDCDHVGPVEQALSRAISDAANCVPSSAGGGTIEYVADVSFGRKVNQIAVTLPKGNRSMKNGKALAACGKAIKRAVKDLTVDGMPHSHGRYTISITATYPGPFRAK